MTHRPVVARTSLAAPCRLRGGDSRHDSRLMRSIILRTGGGDWIVAHQPQQWA